MTATHIQDRFKSDPSFVLGSPEDIKEARALTTHWGFCRHGDGNGDVEILETLTGQRWPFRAGMTIFLGTLRVEYAD